MPVLSKSTRMFRIFLPNRKLHLIILGLFLVSTSVLILLDGGTGIAWVTYRGPEPSCLCEADPCFDPTLSKTDLRNTSIANRQLYTPGKVSPPAVLLRLRGGLGNQLFQFACHYAIARKQNWPLYYYIPSKISNSKRTFRPDRREFSLDQFHIPLCDWNMVDESWEVSKKFQEIGDSEMLAGLYSNDRIISQHQHGNADYCQSEDFFKNYKDEIREVLAQKVLVDNLELENWIKLVDSKPESVAVHIRRGDFVQRGLAVPISFYKNAMKRIALILDVPPVFFIFTDNVDFVTKELISGDGEDFSKQFEIHVVSKNLGFLSNLVSLALGIAPGGMLTSLQEFHLMTRCKHQIIPSSTFGWWAAYLNRNSKKIVIAAHYNIKLMFKADDSFNNWLYKHIYYPSEWITVDPFYQ